jgi:hypothetical protein
MKSTWNSQSIEEQKRIIKLLTDLKPSQLVGLSYKDLALLFQVAFEMKGSHTKSVKIKKNCFDLEMMKDGQREFMRFYPQGPVAVMYQISTELKGKDFKKIYIFTFGAFSVADRKAHQDYSLTVHFKERDEVIAFMRETQVAYKSQHGNGLPKRSTSGNSNPNGLLERIKRWLRNL